MEWVDRSGPTLGTALRLRRDRRGRAGPDEPAVRAARRSLPRRARGPPACAAAPGDRQVTARLGCAQPSSLDGSARLGRPRLRRAERRGHARVALETIAPEVTGHDLLDTGLDNDVEYRVCGARGARGSAGGRGGAAVGPRDGRRRRHHAAASAHRPGRGPLAGRRSASRGRPSPDADVALYAIYRAAGADGLVRVGTAPAGTTTFVDRDVRAGVAYRYAVTAMDRARTPNESVRSNEADRHRALSRSRVRRVPS